MLRTIITSDDERALNELQRNIHSATENAIGFGEENGIKVNPLIKNHDGVSEISVNVGSPTDPNTSTKVVMKVDMANADINVLLDGLSEDAAEDGEYMPVPEEE